jgi:poly-gamma-glutamate capsule biosynthesis protein CapA/YwtB (metallophosphatase superfamily)
MKLKSKIRILQIVLVLLPILVGVSLGFLGWLVGEIKPPKNYNDLRKIDKKRKVDVYRPGELSDEEFKSPPGTKTIVIVGDIMMWDKMEEPLAKNGMNYPFEATAPILRNADLTIGNLECPIAVDAEKRQTTGFFYKVPPQTLSGLTWAGFKIMSLANNHIRDCGDAGVLETMKYLDEAGIRHFGAGRNLDEAKKFEVVDIGGLKVAFVGFMSPEVYLVDGKDTTPKRFDDRKRRIYADLAATATRPGTVIVEKAEEVRDLVSQARGQADLVVVYAHWGVRYGRPVYDLQEQFAHTAIDAGADLVVGSHAHFWQGVEVYKNKAIVYGIGNFAFGSQNWAADEGLLVRAIVKGKKISSVELYPTFIQNRKVAYQSKIMKDDSAKEMLGRLKDASRELGTKVKIEKEKAVVNLK